MPNTQRRIPSLDGLRAVSILIVLAGHLATTRRLPEPVARFVHRAVQEDLGVTIFFVISGFLITSLLLNEKFSSRGLGLRNFYARRSLRILPVCFLYISFVWAYLTFSGERVSSVPFTHALTFTMNFCFAATWLLGHLWSLAIEEQFYLVWPWVLRLSVRAITAAAILVIVLAPAVRLAAHFLPEWRAFFLEPFLGYADSLMVGALLAIGRQASPKRWETLDWGRSPMRFACVFVVWLVCFLTHEGRAGFFTVPFGRTAVSACVAYLLAGAVTRTEGKLFRLLNHPAAVYVGTLSYSLYVWQQFFIYDPVWPGGQEWWRAFPVNLVMSFAAAALSYHLWEKMFLRMKTRFQPSPSR